MLKSLLFSGAALAALLVVTNQAEARGRHSCGCGSAPVAAAPVAQTAAAPASGYRTYSYQPGTATTVVGSSAVRSSNNSGIHRAAWKIIGD